MPLQVDEVGVGALAGPVVEAAVIFAPGVSIDRLADSKLLIAKGGRRWKRLTG
jgi:ribonuclease HII